MTKVQDNLGAGSDRPGYTARTHGSPAAADGSDCVAPARPYRKTEGSELDNSEETVKCALRENGLSERRSNL